ncbi:arsenical-resistance protein [Colletotrichum higginsianum]|nr:arsenical-resistance protein [Colletotrichum higginsianum]
MSNLSSGAVCAPELNKDKAPAEKLANCDTSHDVEQQQHQQHHTETNNAHISSIFHSLGIIDRFLAVWIFLAMLIGIILGNFVPSAGPALQQGKFVGVSIPIVQYEKLYEVFRTREIWIQLGFSVVVNWIIAPLFMARGDGDYCAILVAVNSFLQIVLFAPVALLFIRVIGQDDSISSISYSTVASAVGVFLGIPLGAAILTRLSLIYTIGTKTYNTRVIPFLAPWSLIGLLYTIVVLFASQGSQVVHQIVSVVRVAAPLVVYFSIIFSATLVVARKMGFRYGLACTQAFTAASNNFELAIAIAVAAYGPDSDEALATTVGPLIEVPVLLGLVYCIKWFARRYGWED